MRACKSGDLHYSSGDPDLDAAFEEFARIGGEGGMSARLARCVAGYKPYKKDMIHELGTELYANLKTHFALNTAKYTVKWGIIMIRRGWEAGNLPTLGASFELAKKAAIVMRDAAFSVSGKVQIYLQRFEALLSVPRTEQQWMQRKVDEIRRVLEAGGVSWSVGPLSFFKDNAKGVGVFQDAVVIQVLPWMQRMAADADVFAREVANNMHGGNPPGGGGDDDDWGCDLPTGQGFRIKCKLVMTIVPNAMIKRASVPVYDDILYAMLQELEGLAGYHRARGYRPNDYDPAHPNPFWELRDLVLEHIHAVRSEHQQKKGRPPEEGAASPAPFAMQDMRVSHRALLPLPRPALLPASHPGVLHPLLP